MIKFGIRVLSFYWSATKFTEFATDDTKALVDHEYDDILEATNKCKELRDKYDLKFGVFIKPV